MSVRNYSTVAVQATLTGPITGTDTTANVSDVTGWPAPPFTLIIDKDKAAEEVVEATGLSSTTVTITRGVDGSPALPHEAGATVTHGISARDVREPNAHVNASTGVHGVSGALVGTTDVQNLDHKTFLSVDGSSPPLTVKQAPGQSSNIMEFRTSTGVLAGYLDPAIKLSVPKVEATTQAIFKPASAGTTAVRVVLKPSQSSNAVEVWDSTETNLLFSVGPTGNVYAPNLTQDTLNATNVVAQSVSTQTLNASSSSTLGAVGATSVSVLNALSAGSANVSGQITAASVATTGSVQASSFNSSGAVSGGDGNFAGNITHHGGMPTPRFAAGRATVNVNASDRGVVAITFPNGRFTQAPIVTVSLQNAPGGSGSLNARAYNVTTAGCDLYVYTGNNATTTATGVSLGWHAVQMLDSAAAG